jgi:hypothetical protein
MEVRLWAGRFGVKVLPGRGNGESSKDQDPSSREVPNTKFQSANWTNEREFCDATGEPNLEVGTAGLSRVNDLAFAFRTRSMLRHMLNEKYVVSPGAALRAIQAVMTEQVQNAHKEGTWREDHDAQADKVSRFAGNPQASVEH